MPHDKSATTTPREPTDDEVERFINAQVNSHERDESRKQAVRIGLRAAMNPPPEPEIEVTSKMTAAGVKALVLDLADPVAGPNRFDAPEYRLCGSLSDHVKAIYRAMFAARPAAAQPIFYWQHRRMGDPLPTRHFRRARSNSEVFSHIRAGERGDNDSNVVFRFHRRADDLK